MNASKDGMIIQSDLTLKLDCIVDADFLREELKDYNKPSSVKSCTGFVIKFGGAPVVW